MALAALAAAVACDSPPPPAGENTHGDTPIAGFVDFGAVAVGASATSTVLIAAPSGVSLPAQAHVDIESVPGDAASDPSEFAIPPAANGQVTAPGDVAVTFTPTRIAQDNHALLVDWFTLPDGGEIDRTGYLLRGTSVTPVKSDGG
jgi:hypothetical protein